MKKYILFLIIGLLSLFLTGCNNTSKYEIILDDKYYSSGGFIQLDYENVNDLLEQKESFILFTYNNYCSLPFPCEKIFEQYMKQNNIRFVSITFEDFKKLPLYNYIKYAPTIIIIDKGNIVAYLDAESDDDLNKYQDLREFSKWINQYIKS